MRIHSALLFALLSLSSMGWGQGASWGVGTDPAMWISGWRNVQVGCQFHEEASIVAGAGWMNGARGASALLRPRPVGFDHAVMGSIGLRFHPQPMGDSRLSGVVGLDFSQELFQTTVTTELLQDGVAVQQGRSQYQRSDLRMLAGARARMGRSWTLSAHASVGYVFDRNERGSFSDMPQGTPPVSRILSLELMRWF